ncbi:hypothetical protein LIA77_04771 [Sarocladium implicatum]|nr:hypothetical protein LIA77_04771 [Sarocladium implicatum]
MERVERYDGGLTRYRKQEKEEVTMGPEAVEEGSANTVQAQTGLDGFSEDSDLDQPRAHCSTATASMIWVDMSDPIDGPCFKPSVSKPIPWFMTRPPTPDTD